MYIVNIPDDIIIRLRNADSHSPSVSERIIQLNSNPLVSAIKTNVLKIGDYYVNAGKHCILFNVDIENQIVDVINVVRSAYLHKVLNALIQPK